MGATKLIHGIYSDEEQLLEGVEQVRSSHFNIKEVFTPFPIHGLDHAMGLKRTRIAICSFIYGLTGLGLAILMTWYMMVSDWPEIDIGGKPNFWYFQNWPAFIPVTFESTVFCAAHGMVITFYLRSWLLPGVSPKNPDPRTTDDKFLMELEVKAEDEARVVSILKQTGATEVNVK